MAIRVSALSMILTLLLLPACQDMERSELEGQGQGGAAWISGSVDERFQLIGEQMGGFSSSKWEVAHRYNDLYWAIQDENWAYADYQVDNISSAIERGMIRRPGRAESSQNLFLGTPVDDLLAALEAGDGQAVGQAFTEYTAACNQCHVAEEMDFIVVGPPEARSTVVQP
jgi:hypothetical protein